MSAVTNTNPGKSTVSAANAPTFTDSRLRLGVVAFFVAYLVTAVRWNQHAFFGTMVTHTLVVSTDRPATQAAWSGFEAGLQPGDHILSINGQTLTEDPSDFQTARRTFNAIQRNLVPGETITVTFSRPATNGSVSINGVVVCDEVVDSAAECEVVYTVDRMPVADFVACFVLPYLVGLLTLAIGIGILYVRRTGTNAMLAAAICGSLGVVLAGNFDVNTTYTFVPIWLVMLSLLSGLIMSLALIFPLKSQIASRYPLLPYVPIALAGVVAAVTLMFYYMPNNPQQYSAPWLIGTAAVGVSMVGLATTTLQHRLYSTSPLVRDQSNVLFMGIMLSAAPTLLWMLNAILFNVTGQTFTALSLEATTPFLIIFPLSLAYAVLQFRRFDTDQIISQSIGYAIMLAALILGYSLLVIAASFFAIRSTNPIIISLTIFTIAVLFLPLRTRLQSRIDALYFRTRRNYQNTLEDFARDLPEMVTLPEIITAYRHQLQDTITPKHLHLFTQQPTGDYGTNDDAGATTDIRFSPESGVVKLFASGKDTVQLEPGQPWPPEILDEKSRLRILDPQVLSSMQGSNTLSGFAVIGPPRSGAGRYTFEELRFIENLSGQTAVAVERAQVVSTLENRVKELNVLSQVSQAVNFTISFSDLFELINRQTTRLIDAPYFYIVLWDNATEQQYFAFFLENDERYTAHENIRWAPGDDLFSEVVSTGKAMLCEDYSEEMARRVSDVPFVTQGLRAWMGVPLIAGQNNLGVMAAGMTDISQSYDESQLKIFTDIGSLAATSLDKARLFVEANTRARQLGAINDISRQLASELDVNRLLELITSSAVEILNTEAGSLLLTLDDDSGDLEFKVAIGGSGDDLVGSRLPAGTGLVGEVVGTSEPIIVNNTEEDDRWAGDLASDKFHTQSILAVPLIAKKRTVGVLEVLNKRDGSDFTEEDSILLTTFAGQAAIAIENARQFEMTDRQLQRRVEELQALERIDVELNRSLDLTRVAEITIRWAVANSGAEAGVLGVVHQDPPYLDVIHHYGYAENEMPEGADGSQWPIDQGIVARVMRTRQPDLVPDVTIDPDYVPSKRHALSQITVPMLTGGEVNAIIILEKTTPPRFNLLDLEFVKRLAEHASIAISNAQLYDQLSQVNRSKSEFVSFVAHELKNPLTSIKGYASVLVGGGVGDINDQQQSFLDIIVSNANRMIDLTTELSEFNKLEGETEMEMSPVDFPRVVTSTLRPLQKQIDDKGQKLTTNVADDLPEIIGNEAKLIQVLTNLVSNAHKYSPAGQPITVGAEVKERHTNLKGKEVGPVILVSIKDEGIGMSDEDLNQLFTPYFRSDNPKTREQPGTGLGLAITQLIVQKHGGEIWAESIIDEGTTFFFTLPVSKENLKAPSNGRRREPTQ